MYEAAKAELSVLNLEKKILWAMVTALKTEKVSTIACTIKEELSVASAELLSLKTKVSAFESEKETQTHEVAALRDVIKEMTEKAKCVEADDLCGDEQFMDEGVDDEYFIGADISFYIRPSPPARLDGFEAIEV